MKALSVRLQIDNFSTSYSSLSYLQGLINTLKIERAFVSKMGTDSEHSKIVQSSVKLAHNLGLDAIAKGVGTAEQLAQLKALKCEYGHGYFFSKSVDTKAVEALMMADIEA